MRIDVYAHGADALWLSIGSFLCDRAVHKELGGPIYSTALTTWLVARDKDTRVVGFADRVIGFASLRAAAKATWLDYAYVVPGARSQGVFDRLSAMREQLAAPLKLPLRTVVRKDRWEHYRARGWKLASARGSWIHAVKEIP